MHPSESELALYAGQDLGFWAQWTVRRHLAECSQCARAVSAFQADRESLRTRNEMPAGVDFERLSAEMTANIRLGLAAGECVATPARPGYFGDWQRPVVVFAGSVLAVFIAWIVYSQQPPAPVTASVPAGVMVEANEEGIELSDNGRVLTLRHSSEEQVISVSLRGAVGARYVDSETGQVTINNVYVQ